MNEILDVLCVLSIISYLLTDLLYIPLAFYDFSRNLFCCSCHMHLRLTVDHSKRRKIKEKISSIINTGKSQCYNEHCKRLQASSNDWSVLIFYRKSVFNSQNILFATSLKLHQLPALFAEHWNRSSEREANLAPLLLPLGYLACPHPQPFPVIWSYSS